MMEKEIWKKIPGFSKYSISNFGNMRNNKRLLKKSYNGDGYRYTIIKNDKGEQRGVYLHYLVLLTFIGKRPKGYCVRHLDGNKKNIRLSNLSYGTFKENEADKIIHGIHRGSKPKLKESQVLKIKQLLKTPMLVKSIAAKFKISRQAITDIKFNRTWINI